LKPSRQKKVLGLAIGERSLLAAEVVAGDRPQVTRLAEMVYPDGISFNQPVELAKALSHFMKDNQFSTRSAIIGIPLKWLVIKPKEVPPADDATVAQLLRLEAEAEFSTELKDLVYDFTGEAAPAGNAARHVLLAATPKKYIDLIEAVCDGARLKPLSITPSAVALGAITGASLKREVLVLSTDSAGSELSRQYLSAATAIRSLRPATPQPPFISELRRAVSNLPTSGGERELILWDAAGVDAAGLGQQIGVNVRKGDLETLGVDAASAGLNGQSTKFASAIALALSAMDDAGPAIDFLHSRLAPPREGKIPRWAYAAAALVVVLIGLSIYAYSYLGQREADVQGYRDKIAAGQSKADEARDFVTKASFAKNWHVGDARYLACLRDLDDVIPEDGQTYATSLDIKSDSPSLNPEASSATPAPSADETRSLFVTLTGHTASLESVTALEDRMRHNPTAFTDIKNGPETRVPRTQEYLFSITFTYVPSKPAPPAGGSAK
jgi:hypothetical protein